MKSIRIFIGAVKSKYGVYSITLMDEESNIFSLETKKVFESKCSLHRLTLLAILDATNQLNDPAIKDKYKFIFYPNNEKIVFEWNHEYLQDRAFSESTEDKDLYKKLITIITKNNNEILIKGKESVLASINKLGLKK